METVMNLKKYRNFNKDQPKKYQTNNQMPIYALFIHSIPVLFPSHEMRISVQRYLKREKGG